VVETLKIQKIGEDMGQSEFSEVVILPIGQSGTEEYDRRSSAEGATGRALT
jgi:hypothetical protein